MPLASVATGSHLCSVHGLQLADDIVEMIRSRDGRYHPQAYLFVLTALEYCQRQRTERGHISGADLARGCRDFALEQFGLTAQAVLDHWGIQQTADFGRMVFTLVELGLLAAQPHDRLEDFDGVYAFGQAFGEYSWSGVSRPTVTQRPGR
ncbi:MAG: Minf_1886 family protein [Gemmatimonadales bacterium]